LFIFRCNIYKSILSCLRKFKLNYKIIYIQYIMSEVKPMTAGKRKINKSLKAWVTFVKKVQKEEKLSYKDAIHRAKVRKDKGEKWMTGGQTPPTGPMDIVNDDDNDYAGEPMDIVNDDRSGPMDVVNDDGSVPMDVNERGGRRRRRTMRKSKGRGKTARKSRGRGRGRSARRARGRASRRH